MNIGITEKEFHTLRAKAAMMGYILHRTDADDGPVSYFAESQGQLYHLPTPESLLAFVARAQPIRKWAYPRQAFRAMRGR